MKATVEISLYPLTEQYEQAVIDFITALKANDDIRIEVNGLSTQIFGPYRAIMQYLTDEMMAFFEQQKGVFVLKIAATELTKEKLPEVLK